MSIAALTEEEVNQPHIVALLPMGLMYVGGRYLPSTKETLAQRATKYGQMHYLLSHGGRKFMRQDLTNELLNQRRLQADTNRKFMEGEA